MERDPYKWGFGPLPSAPIAAIEPPELSDWECELFGTGRKMVLVPLKGKEPNSFWRLMQYLILGNRWVRRVLVSKNKKFTFDLKEGNIGIG